MISKFFIDRPVFASVISIIIVIATDAPLLPHQLKRLARRASLSSSRNRTCPRRAAWVLTTSTERTGPDTSAVTCAESAAT